MAIQKAQIASITCWTSDLGLVRMASILDSKRCLCDEIWFLIGSNMGGASPRLMVLFSSLEMTSTFAAIRTEVPRLNALGRHV